MLSLPWNSSNLKANARFLIFHYEYFKVDISCTCRLSGSGGTFEGEGRKRDPSHLRTDMVLNWSCSFHAGQGNTSERIPVMEPDDRRISVTQSRQSYANGKVNGDAHSVRSLSPPASVEPSVAPHPKSYMEIMAMVQRGEKPSNIRDINDQPPNPNQPVPDRVAAKPKPWEVGQSRSNSNFIQSQGSGDGLNYVYQDNMTNGDSSAPWFQHKNARITEIETEGEQNFGSPAAPVQERPILRSWVPPQPPPVAMAEAAAAIRQPKKPAFQNEQLTDDQLLSRSSEITDELQRVTRISESGGAPEANGSVLAYR